jgi:murein DD-endopeptidase MepM/ murein hydrolase activator NlpD
LPSRVHASAPAFVWPASGRITAGFHEPSYSDHFGIPHEAIDIAAEQGTPVLAAADGIVFLARDGGATGYSYVLIGHQDGFATLYGHLSSFAVSAGDVVAAGEVIGQSGGTPGTHGAGPMTTGPHLHFEVIQNGLHIDPRLILP